MLRGAADRDLDDMPTQRHRWLGPGRGLAGALVALGLVGGVCAPEKEDAARQAPATESAEEAPLTRDRLEGGELTKEELYAARQYAAYLELVADVDEALAQKRKLVSRQTEFLCGDSASVMMRRALLADGARIFEAYVGLGRRMDAALFVDRLLDIDSDGSTYALLIRHAHRAGAADWAAMLAAEAECKGLDCEWNRKTRK